ncbi:MAG TPA: CDP-glucose 4,6-dehydratase [Ferruginibacter sp.]|nr:CDP-glucose 4,6-dehydratase [Ferruginibacter sp.]HRE62396.1 CDP-glucose 4,6-dehydratase [Ferruginibacter sp.]
MVNFQQLAQAYKGKKIFITGHTGFKGSWLCLWLQQLGATIKGYALEPEVKPNLYDSLVAENKIESVIADIRDKEKLQAEIISFQPDFIFHLAAQPLVRKSYLIPSETFEVNAIGTANLLEAVIPLVKKCTVIIITTDKVYENLEQDILYKEEDRLGGYDPYSASKACTEIVVSSFRNSFFNPANYQLHQKAIVAARAGNVIGGGDFSADRIIPDIIRSLSQNKPVEVRNPASVRPWQHVIEPLGGYLQLGLLANEDATKYSGAYNFGPQPTDHLTVKEIVENAIRIWGSGEWKSVQQEQQPHEATLLKLDISKAKKELNWQPKLSAAEAIDWTISWYKKNQSEWLTYSREQIKKYMQQ